MESSLSTCKQQRIYEPLAQILVAIQELFRLVTIDRQAVTCLLYFMADVFEALGAPARRAILDELTDRDGQTLFELCARLTMKHDLALTRQAVSQHLAILEAAGLIRTQREGRYKYHFLDTTPLAQAIVNRWLKPKRKASDK